jgi:hypothetical protein
MEINYCLKKGKGKGNLYLPCFVVITLFCRRALMSSHSYVAALLCRRALMSHALLSRALFVARFCRNTPHTHTCFIITLCALHLNSKNISSLHTTMYCYVSKLSRPHHLAKDTRAFRSVIFLRTRSSWMRRKE